VVALVKVVVAIKLADLLVVQEVVDQVLLQHPHWLDLLALLVKEMMVGQVALITVALLEVVALAQLVETVVTEHQVMVALVVLDLLLQ
jgi:hypothetical protein